MTPFSGPEIPLQCDLLRPPSPSSPGTTTKKFIYLVVLPSLRDISQGRKKPININNFAGLSRKWVGVKLFMCFPFSWGKRETHKQNSQETSGKGRDSPGIIPGQSRENFVYVFSCLLVFSRPQYPSKNPGMSRRRSLFSLGFEGWNEVFWHPPLHVEDVQATTNSGKKKHFMRKHAIERALQNRSWRPPKVGFVWSGGGVKNVLGEGSCGMFSPPPSFSLPFVAHWKKTMSELFS